MRNGYGKVAPKHRGSSRRNTGEAVRGWGGSYAKPDLQGKKRGRPPGNAHPAWS